MSCVPVRATEFRAVLRGGRLTLEIEPSLPIGHRLAAQVLSGGARDIHLRLLDCDDGGPEASRSTSIAAPGVERGWALHLHHAEGVSRVVIELADEPPPALSPQPPVNAPIESSDETRPRASPPPAQPSRSRAPWFSPLDWLRDRGRVAGDKPPVTRSAPPPTTGRPTRDFALPESVAEGESGGAAERGSVWRQAQGPLLSCCRS